MRRPADRKLLQMQPAGRTAGKGEKRPFPIAQRHRVKGAGNWLGIPQVKSDSTENR